MDGSEAAFAARARGIAGERGPGRVLDVGCGPGGLLDAFGRLGWSGVGVEPQSSAAARAQALGLDVRVESWHDVQLADELPFDLVVMLHVLEHLADPVTALEKVRQNLAPGGRLFLEVPNRSVAGLALRPRLQRQVYDLPVHLHHFTVDSLRGVLSRSGFENVRVVPSVPALVVTVVDGLSRFRRHFGRGPISKPGDSSRSSHAGSAKSDSSRPGHAGQVKGDSSRPPWQAAGEKRERMRSPSSGGAEPSGSGMWLSGGDGKRSGSGARLIDLARRRTQGFKLVARAEVA